MNEITPINQGDDTALSVPGQTQVATTAEPGALLSAIVQLSKDPDFDVTKLKALMEMQERLEDRQAQRTFALALKEARAEIPQIEKRGTVELGAGKGSYKFARYEDMDKVLRPILDRHGFTLQFTTRAREGGGSVIVGRLMHTAGHSEEAEISLPLDAGPGRNNLQAMGSTISYGQRYLTEMLLGLVRKGQDDDAVQGGKRYITAAEADELSALCKEVGRTDGQLLDRMFGGTVRSFDELEQGAPYLAVRNTLLGMKAQRQKKQEA